MGDPTNNTTAAKQAASQGATQAPQTDAEKAKAAEDAKLEAARVRRERDEQDDNDDRVGDDAPWKSTPGAKTAQFVVMCKIRGQLQGKKAPKIGTVVTLELTPDIEHMIRPGCLEPVGGLAR